MNVTDELLQDMNNLCANYKTQDDFALTFEMQQSHVSLCKRGLRSIPTRILDILGWEKVTIYRRKETS